LLKVALNTITLVMNIKLVFVASSLNIKEQRLFDSYFNCKITDKIYHILVMLYRVHFTRVGFELTTLVVIGSYKSNYHTITLVMNIKLVFVASSLNIKEQRLFDSYFNCKKTLKILKR
jgi:hypothetical protein